MPLEYTPEIVFSLPYTGEADIVFGAESVTDTDLTGAATLPALTVQGQVFARAELTGDASLPGLSVHGRLSPPVELTGAVELPSMTAAGELSQAAIVTGSVVLPSWSSSGELRYASNTSRPTVGQSDSPWQVATKSQDGVTHPQQIATRQPVGWSTPWQLGTAAPEQFAHPLPDVLKPNASRIRGVFEQGTRSSEDVSSRHQDGIRTYVGILGTFQGGTPIRQSTALPHQDGDHSKRASRTAPWQSAKPLGIIRHGSFQKATPNRWGWQGPFQGARRPPAGISYPPVPPVLPPIPADPTLLFWQAWDGAPWLLFGDSAAATIAILPARYYMTIHTITACRLPDMADVPLFDATIATDTGSWCWSLTASGPAALFALLAPDNAGVPTQLQITLNGIPWVFIIDSISRQTGFARDGVSIQGRSATALIGAPYARAEARNNTNNDYTAQQLAAAALQFTDIDLDWGLTDWLVPAGAWSHTGTPLDAIQTIAQAAGGYVQSHPSMATLLTRHPYSQRTGDLGGAPWGWSEGSADVELAPDAIILDSTARKDGADINAVYASGTTYGVLALVKRTGTAGDKLAQMVTDPLITHVDAARQRGLSILGAAGPQYDVRLELPVLMGQGQPGFLQVGQLVQINATNPWRGRVRAVSIATRRPALRQSITLERHLAAAAP